MPEDVTIVKFQTIVREAREIVVGRIKVPTVSNVDGVHDHLLISNSPARTLTPLSSVGTTPMRYLSPQCTKSPSPAQQRTMRNVKWIGLVAPPPSKRCPYVLRQVKSSYDTRNTNGGRGCEAVRLAGQWYVSMDYLSRIMADFLAGSAGILPSTSLPHTVSRSLYR